MYRLLLGFATFIVSSFACCYAPIDSLAAAELRVVTYNTTTDVRLGLDVVLEAIGDEVVGGISRPIDVLAVQEQSSVATDTANIVGILNGIYGPGTYDHATLDVGTSGAGRPGLVFNTTTIELLDQTAFGTVNTSAQARDPRLLQLDSAGSSVASSNPIRPTAACSCLSIADAIG